MGNSRRYTMQFSWVFIHMNYSWFNHGNYMCCLAHNPSPVVGNKSGQSCPQLICSCALRRPARQFGDIFTTVRFWQTPYLFLERTYRSVPKIS